MRRLPQILALSLALATVSAHWAEAADLFQAVPPNAAAASADQQAALDRLRGLPTTQEAQVVRLNLDALQDATTTMAVPGAPSLTATRTNVERRSATSYTWFGSLAGAPGEATLVVNDGKVTGTIRSGNELFRVTPLGNGLHAVIKVDQARFPPEHPPSWQQRERRGDIQPPPQRDVQRGDASVVIDVLVGYTRSAASAVGDIGGTIQLAVDEANHSYQNSRINLRLNLVGTFEHVYMEGTSSFDKILDDFEANADVNNWRNGSGADVAVLIINKSDYCGMATTVQANANNPFAIVHYDCATGYYSFAHEIGHLQGARHDPATDSSTTPFAYGHGYQHPDVDPAKRFRTIMAYKCTAPSDCNPRIQYWSNPDVSFNGIATGTSATNNNARVLNGTASTVAGFRSQVSFAPNQDWIEVPYFGSRGTFFADVDGDGKADAIVSNEGQNGRVTVRLSAGTGFAPNQDRTEIPYYGSRGTFFADVNGDKKADAIASNDGPNGRVTVRMGR